MSATGVLIAITVALDTSDTGGVVVPLAIIAGCFVIILISVLIRWARNRRAAARLDRAGHDDTGAGADWNEAPTDMAAWQSDHGHSVDRWLDAHEGSLPALVPGTDPEIDAELDRAMADAAAVCPNPGVSATLVGMRETARATRLALTRGDRQAAEVAHEQYGRNRAGAIEALQAPDAPAAG